MSEKEIRQAKREAKTARNAQIVDRIQAGEKRYMLAEEYKLDVHTIGHIGARAGLPPFCRFRQTKN